MMNVCGPSDGAEERIVGVRKRKKKRKGQITEEIAMGREACLLGSCEIGETPEGQRKIKGNHVRPRQHKTGTKFDWW